MEQAQSKRRPSHLPTITKELVFEACAALKADKRGVTNQSVRQALGGGSFLTINPWVREWQQAQDERFRLSLTEIPDEVKKAANFYAQEMWRTASDLASQQLVDLGKRLQDTETEHQRQLREYDEEIDTLEKERESFTAVRESEEQKLAEAQQAIALLESELRETKQNLSLTRARETDAERFKVQLQDELKTARAEAAKASKLEAKLEIEEENGSRLRIELDTITADRDKFRIQFEKVGSELERLRADLNDSRQQLTLQQKKAIESHAELQKSTVQQEFLLTIQNMRQSLKQEILDELDQKELSADKKKDGNEA